MKAKANPVVHFEIGCPDMAAATEFYQKTFGWEMVAGPRSTQINTLSEKGIQGHMTSLGHEPHNYINIYIEVEDIDATLNEIETNGGSRIVGPIDIDDGMQFAWFKDVAGNTVALITPGQQS